MTAERETGRTLSDAPQEYIERPTDDDEGVITFVAHTLPTRLMHI